MLRHYSNSSSQHRHHQSIAPATMASASTTFPLFFPLPDDTTKQPYQCVPADHGFDDDSHSSVSTSPSSPSSSAGSVVDCTLSLGTPSSRRPASETAKQQRPASSSCGAVSWSAGADHQSYCFSCCCQGGSRPSPAAANAAAMNKSAGAPCARHGQQDPMLVDRRCANCGTSSTPLWRNGPRGPKSLCNACGIRFKKEERRAATATAAAAAMDQQGGCGYFAQRAQYGGGAAAAVPYGGGCEAPVFPCGGGDVADADAAVPPQFLAWRFDVVAPPAQATAFAAAVWPDRTTMFQYN